MTITNRLNLQNSFAVSADEAADFLSTPGAQVKPQDGTDLHEPSGPMTRADTIRRRSDSHTPIAPLTERDDLTERFTHPHVLEAIEDAEQAREARDEEANVFEQAHRSTQLKQAEQEVQQRREEVGELLERIENGQTLDGEQMALLLDRDDIDPETETITSSVTGTTYTAETPELLGTMHGDRIGSSALWSAEDARTLYHDLPIRVLRERAGEIESRPREASAVEHVESVGVEAVIEADPHFRTEEAEDSGDETGAGSPPTADPRREARPHFITT